MHTASATSQKTPSEWFSFLVSELQPVFLKVLFKKLAKYAFGSVLFLNSYGVKQALK